MFKDYKTLLNGLSNVSKYSREQRQKENYTNQLEYTLGESLKKINEERLIKKKMIEEKIIKEKIIEEQIIKEKLLEEKLLEKKIENEQIIKERDDLIPIHDLNIDDIAFTKIDTLVDSIDLSFLETDASKQLFKSNILEDKTDLELFKDKQDLVDSKIPYIDLNIHSIIPENCNYDVKKMLYNEFTDFVNKHYIVNRDEYFYFISNILAKYNKKFMEIYGKDDFLKLNFKGGTLLRTIFNRYNEELDYNVKKYIKKNFDNIFGLSDFDYDIMINDSKYKTDPEYNKLINLYINNLFMVLHNIKQIINDNIYVFFKLFTKSNNYINNKFQKLGDSIQNILNNKVTGCNLEGATLLGIQYTDGNHKPQLVELNGGIGKNVFNKYNIDKKLLSDKQIWKPDSIFHNNFVIVKKDMLEKNLLDITIEQYSLDSNIFLQHMSPTIKMPLNQKSSLYISYNIQKYTKIENVDFINHFYLLRIKINFQILLKLKDNTCVYLNVPSELLDVSSHLSDHYKNTLFDDTMYSKSKLQNNNILYSYNLYGLIFDLFLYVYLESNNRPWIDKKYNKRIERLIFLIGLFIMYDKNIVSKYNMKERITILENFKNNITKNEKNELPIEIDFITKHFYATNNLFNDSLLSPDEIIEYKKYITIIDKKLDIIIVAFKVAYNYNKKMANKVPIDIEIKTSDINNKYYRK